MQCFSMGIIRHKCLLWEKMEINNGAIASGNKGNGQKYNQQNIRGKITGQAGKKKWMVTGAEFEQRLLNSEDHFSFFSFGRKQDREG